jgi:hypothetical protein
MSKDKCVMCGVETEYNIYTNVNLRYGYIEGMGQLCVKCRKDEEPEKTISIPIDLIKSISNDMELGEKIRRMVNQK